MKIETRYLVSYISENKFLPQVSHFLFANG